MNDKGQMLTCENICKNLQIDCMKLMYKKQLKTIPATVKSMVTDDLMHSKVATRLNRLHIEIISFTDKRITNTFIRSFLMKDLFPNQIKQQYILKMI